MAHRNQKFRFSPDKEKAREKSDKQQQQQHQQQHQQQYQQKQEHHQPQQHYQQPKESHEHRHSFYGEKEKDPAGLSDSSRTSQEEEKPSKEEKEAKKTRVKQSLMKRARSVAIFSLKLKEKRAKDAETKAKEAEKEARWQKPQSLGVGGELSCIPIEKLISVDDIEAMEMRRVHH